MRYIPNTVKVRNDMLEEMKVSSFESFLESIPEHLKLQEPLNFPKGLPEADEIDYFKQLAAKNEGAHCYSFLGGGAYDHFIPLVTDSLISRAEFLTSYTPYQPEISQGTLQCIFEFQSYICMFTGLDVANASVYDGASALAEGVLMANRIQRKRRNVIIPKSLNPNYLQVLKTYIAQLDIQLQEVAYDETGRIDESELASLVNEDTIAVVVQQPNFYGVIENIHTIDQVAKTSGALSISVTTEALSLALLDAPGAQGADIAVGEAQSFGIPMSFGGPYLGFMATKDAYKRNMPGRMVGRTVDADGKPGFVITLATREQHIRREKATSNICTNQNLIMMMAVMHLSVMGRKGLQEAAYQNVAKTQYFQKRLQELSGFKLHFTGDVFNEFILECPQSAARVIAFCEDSDIIPGIDLALYDKSMENCLLVTITEQKSKEVLDNFITTLKQLS